MERITANVSGKAKRVTWRGRDYLVAPVSSIVPGVHAGSQGPLLYEADDIGLDVIAWNDKPATVGHPVVNGQHVTALRPDVLERQGVGRVFESVFNGKLQHALYVDVQDARRVDPRLVEKLERGELIEVSTGLYVTHEPAPDGAVFNSPGGPVPYKSVARNLKPDHLAILLDEKGACSIEAGCGVFNAAAYPEKCPHCGGAVDAKTGKCKECGMQLEANAKKKQPSDAADVTPEKACKILRDKSVNGHPLSPSQRGMFGAICGKKKPTANSSVPACGEPGWECSVCNTTHEESTMLTADQKKAIVDGLVANCECQDDLPWKGKDAAALNAMSDEKLMTMDECRKAVAKMKPAANAAPVVNAAPAALPVAPPVVTAQDFVTAVFGPGATVASVRNEMGLAKRILQSTTDQVVNSLRSVAAIEQDPRRKELIENSIKSGDLDDMNRTLTLVGFKIGRAHV